MGDAKGTFSINFYDSELAETWSEKGFATYEKALERIDECTDEYFEDGGPGSLRMTVLDPKGTAIYATTTDAGKRRLHALSGGA